MNSQELDTTTLAPGIENNSKARGFLEVFAAGLEALRGPLQTATSWILALQAAGDDVNAWFRRNTERLAQYAKLIAQIADEMKLAEEVVNQALRKARWPLSPDTPVLFWIKVAELAVKPGVQPSHQAEAIDNLFVEYYTSDHHQALTEMVLGWQQNAHFQPRMEILKDCLSVISTAAPGINVSNVVIPAMIAQMDGVKTDILESMGLQRVITRDKRGKRRIEQNRWEDTSGQERNWKDWLRDEMESQPQFRQIAGDVLLETLYETAYPGQQVGWGTFSRHKIVHGESLKYGTLPNTIRAFLILDFLASFS
ncbi:MAG: hypothetical protein JW759_03895 [Candidatus Coatesbacteria bacterium]|nr:hypothetical protein [Candidatus Coatesbacteria bacterium]